MEPEPTLEDAEASIAAKEAAAAAAAAAPVRSERRDSDVGTRRKAPRSGVTTKGPVEWIHLNESEVADDKFEDAKELKSAEQWGRASTDPFQVTHRPTARQKNQFRRELSKLPREVVKRFANAISGGNIPEPEVFAADPKLLEALYDQVTTTTSSTTIRGTCHLPSASTSRRGRSSRSTAPTTCRRR